MASSYATVFAASRDDETLWWKKGRHGSLDHTGVAIPAEPSLGLLPIEVDPPELRAFRSVLNPAFSPKMVARLVPEFECLASWRVDRAIESGEIDFVEDIANRVPAMTTLPVGLPVGDWPRSDQVHQRPPERSPCRQGQS